ncbi:MAG: pilus assembly protein N-terminal domain-containing protein [Phenylobacterium sp.]|uniref:pilus assembly protein N-terminal domain-containing protein n=1 Tax=Phenylobacterium sp. TaxID=1871053 RepID=UPI001B7AFA00|nr:pilus assembly protein N-terminal domain-containing protein [Phenylobacterium sp.]MBP7650580.1 pilus assembly protein N-terminal domain-containing protein [Phenylobacterium sp.]MBP7816200.1 pilus assembly protein N-terminal domain-containing protein [Phenylobacterium sp.]MBP9755716.1 pilus assembly protein N-terminal domain-containing protein [Phenylobacterium sp.]
MRRPLFATALAVLALAAQVSVAGAATISAVMDQGVRISLPAGARDVLIGNPAIADINVIDSRTAIVQGRAYGVTNLMIIDARGRTIQNNQVVVSGPEVNRVSIYQGPNSGALAANVANYSCAPRCERTPMPGEIDSEYNRFSMPFNAYAQRAAEARRAVGQNGQ